MISRPPASITLKLMAVYFSLFVPVLMLYLTDPFSGPVAISQNEKLLTYASVFGIGVILVVTVFIALKNTKSSFLSWILGLVLASGSLALMAFPQKIIQRMQESMAENSNQKMLALLQARISDDVLQNTPGNTAHGGLSTSPVGLVYDLTNDKLDFNRARHLFGKNIKYARSIDELDFVLLIKNDEPELLTDLTKFNWFAELVNIDTQRPYHLFTVDSDVGILDWKKGVVTENKHIEADIPEHISAKQLNSDMYFHPYEFRIKDWLNKILFDNKERPKELDPFIYFIGLILAPILVGASLLKQGGEQSGKQSVSGR